MNLATTVGYPWEYHIPKMGKLPVNQSQQLNNISYIFIFIYISPQLNSH